VAKSTRKAARKAEKPARRLAKKAERAEKRLAALTPARPAHK
jgi:hypothetical protein